MQDHARTWLRRQTSHWRDWPPERLLAAKRAAGTRISVVIPARNEERTVGRVVTAVRQALLIDTPLVDEIVVVDSDSTDGTARAAERAGGTVYRACDIVPALGSHPGKGEALWKSLLVTHGDLLVFVDADLTRWGPHFVTGLLGPLLAGQPNPGQQVQLVKGFYERVRTERDGSTSSEGGRVTELVARPLLSLWWPELAGVVQPLAGEWAARRGLMESLTIPVGYGVELSTLLDTFTRLRPRRAGPGGSGLPGAPPPGRPRPGPDGRGADGRRRGPAGPPRDTPPGAAPVRPGGRPGAAAVAGHPEPRTAAHRDREGGVR